MKPLAILLALAAGALVALLAAARLYRSMLGATAGSGAGGCGTLAFWGLAAAGLAAAAIWAWRRATDDESDGG